MQSEIMLLAVLHTIAHMYMAFSNSYTLLLAMFSDHIKGSHHLQCCQLKILTQSQDCPKFQYNKNPKKSVVSVLFIQENEVFLVG